MTSCSDFDALFGPGPAPLDAALAHLGASYQPVTGLEEVELRSAAGRILAQEVTAPFDVPPCAVSAMDGYGFAHPSGQGAATFTVVGRVPAGSVYEGSVAAGEAVRIFTGAPIPAGVDTVAIQEDCRAGIGAEAGTATVTVNHLPPAGANVRPAGEDMQCGQTVLHPGTRLRPQEIGLAAAVGLRRVTVRTRLRVGLFSTGDELREPGTDKPAGTIYDTNRYSNYALMTGLGCAVTDLGILPDKPDLVRAALAEAAGQVDLLVTSGGVSVGEEDHIKAVIASLGHIDLWRLAVRPGKPLALGRVGEAVFLGLPGNPVSAMVTFMLMGRSLILRLSGASRWMPLRTMVRADFSFAKKAGRREFLRVRLEPGPDGWPVAHKFPSDSSGVLTSLVQADGLLDVPEATTSVAPGDVMGFFPFNGLSG